jgi:ATP-binding cassette, subfamily B, bacterial HlyB/CyaB
MDTGLAALVALAQFHQIATNPQKLHHLFGVEDQPFDDIRLLQAAASLSLKAKNISVSLSALKPANLPCIGKSNSGEYFILAKTACDESGNIKSVLVHDLRKQAPEIMELAEFELLWSGQVILVSKNISVADTLARKFDISWFLPSLVKYRKLFAEVLLASFILQLFALVTPFFFQVVMDKVVVHRGFSTLDVLAVGFLIAVVFEAFMGGFRNYLFSHTTNRVDIELGARLYNHLLALPLPYFESRQVGQNVARVRELDTIRNFITGTALTLVIDLLFVFLFIAVLWYYSPALTWVVVATIPLYVLLSIMITPVLRQRLNEKFKHSAANTSFLTESISGIETVKALSVEPQMQRRLEDNLSNYVGASFKSTNLTNIASQISGLINKLMTLGIVWFGAHLVINGEITVGQLIAVNMIAGRISGPVLKLVQLWQDFQQAGISVQRLGDILNAPREPNQGKSSSTMEHIQGEIEFRNVDFRYSVDGPAILKSISFTIPKGQSIGIVGSSGSGKSTIAKLLQRLYVPEGGRICVDGIDLGTIDPTVLRRQVGVVLQDSFLFNRTIRENIAIINPSIPMDRVIEAAKLSGAHAFVSELPNGYDTLVEEQGSNLSGGQRQRIAIARALINNPQILIFDEATSALDYESEKIIRDNMQAISANRTVLIIAHRLSAVEQCDNILVLEKGSVVEFGTPQALKASNGRYAQLHAIQQKPTLKNSPKIQTTGNPNISLQRGAKPAKSEATV